MWKCKISVSIELFFRMHWWGTYVFYFEISTYKKTWRCFVCRHIMSLQIDAFMLLCVTFVHVTYNYFWLIYFYYYFLLLAVYYINIFITYICSSIYYNIIITYNPKDVNYSRLYHHHHALDQTIFLWDHHYSSWGAYTTKYVTLYYYLRIYYIQHYTDELEIHRRTGWCFRK